MSKPLRPKPGPTLVVERFAVCVGGEVKGGTWMKWARFGASAASAPPCVGAKGGLCVCGDQWTSLSLLPPSLPGRDVSSVLPRSDRHADPPRVAKTADTFLPWSRFFGGGLFDEGMHVPNWVSWSLCTYGPIDHLIKALPSELIEGGGIGALLLLGFNSLFLNEPLPWRTLCLAFQILFATRKCSFSLEIWWASKSIA